jgi:hypothetical protein
MEAFQKWWAAIERPRKIMLIGVTAMLVSLFFNYVSAGTSERHVEALGMVSPNSSVGGSTFTVNVPVAGQSGWELHPFDIVFLLALAVMFATGMKPGESVKRWWYWIGVALLVCCILPFDTEDAPGLGVLIAIVAIGLGVYAARVYSGTTAAPKV